MVTPALPGFDKVNVCELLVPIMTLEKLALVGVTVNAGWTLVPLSEIVAGELEALLITEMLPATVPVVVGSKVTLSEACCPAARVSGTEIPLAAKTLPETLI